MAENVLLDRALETCTVTGLTTTVSLLGALPGGYITLYQAGELDIDDTFPYVLRHVNAALEEWEIGVGTLLSETTFQRGNISRSSNGGALVSFTAGYKYVWNDATAEYLSSFVTETDLTNALTGYVTTTTLATTLASYATDAEVTTLLTDYTTPSAVNGLIAAASILSSQVSGNFNASRIDDGVFSSARIPDLSGTYSTPASVATQIAGATILSSQISGNFAASRIDSGTLDDARLPTTMAGKTLTTPTIASFANAVHTHLDAAGGGTLTGPSIGSGDIAAARIAAALAGGTLPFSGTTIAGTTGTFNGNLSVNNAIVIPANNSRLRLIGATAIGNGASIDLTGSGFATPSSILFNVSGTAVLTMLNTGNIGIGITPVTRLHVGVTDTVAENTTNVQTIARNSASSGVAGYGVATLYTLKSSVTADRSASLIETVWNDPTDAAAIPDLVLSAYHNAAGTLTKREGFRVRGGVTATQWAIAGATPSATATVTGSRGGNAALADLITKLAAKGIIIDGTSA